MSSRESKPSIFDKLTNPKLYTGSHKQRFDEEGRGRGKAGRVDDDGPRDLSQMTRPSLHPDSAKYTADVPTGAKVRDSTEQRGTLLGW